MTSIPNNPFNVPDPEELHILMRRAHTERAEVIKAMFTALFTRRKAHASQDVAPAGLKAVPCA